MEFLDLNRQYRIIKKEVNQAIQKVLDSGHFILGPEVEELEGQIAKYCGVKYGVGVNSGTDALLLSLMALGIGKGDEVITTPFTFMATAETIVMCGARPIFVDIDSATFNIDVDKIEEVITKKTKAIIPVHLYGQPAEMDKMIRIARKYKLRIIEDCAQAIGAKYKNKKVGSMGDLGCFSFFPSKNLGACGDGGMVATNNKKLAEKIRMLRAHGSRKKYYHEIIGTNSRLSTIQAAILLVKLKYLDEWTKVRQKIARHYSRSFGKFINLRAPFVASNRTHVFHQYTIRVNKQKRDKLIDYLKQQDIPTAIYYLLPLHLQPSMKFLGYKKGDFPVAEKAAREVLSLPIYPELNINKEQNRIINTINKFIIKQAREMKNKVFHFRAGADNTGLTPFIN